MAHSGCCCVLLSGFWDAASSRHLATLLLLADLLPGGHSCDTRQRVSWQGKLSAHFEWIRVPKWSSYLNRGRVSYTPLRGSSGLCFDTTVDLKGNEGMSPTAASPVLRNVLGSGERLWILTGGWIRGHQIQPLIFADHLVSSKYLYLWCPHFSVLNVKNALTD